MPLHREATMERLEPQACRRKSAARRAALQRGAHAYTRGYCINANTVHYPFPNGFCDCPLPSSPMKGEVSLSVLARFVPNHRRGTLPFMGRVGEGKSRSQTVSAAGETSG